MAKRANCKQSLQAITLCISLFADVVYSSFPTPFLAPWFSKNGYSNKEIGFNLGSFQVSSLLGYAIAILTTIYGPSQPTDLDEKARYELEGRLQKRRWWFLVGSAFFVGLSGLAIWMRTDYWTLLIARCVQGIASSVVWSYGMSLSANIPPVMGVQSSSLVMAGSCLGEVAGPWLGTLVHKLTGGDVGLCFLPFAIFSFLNMFLLMIVARWRLDEAEYAEDPEAALERRRRQLLKKRRHHLKRLHKEYRSSYSIRMSKGGAQDQEGPILTTDSSSSSLEPSFSAPVVAVTDVTGSVNAPAESSGDIGSARAAAIAAQKRREAIKEKRRKQRTLSTGFESGRAGRLYGHAADEPFDAAHPGVHYPGWHLHQAAHGRGPYAQHVAEIWDAARKGSINATTLRDHTLARLTEIMTQAEQYESTPASPSVSLSSNLSASLLEHPQQQSPWASIWQLFKNRTFLLLTGSLLFTGIPRTAFDILLPLHLKGDTTEEGEDEDDPTGTIGRVFGIASVFFVLGSVLTGRLIQTWPNPRWLCFLVAILLPVNIASVLYAPDDTVITVLYSSFCTLVIFIEVIVVAQLESFAEDLQEDDPNISDKVMSWSCLMWTGGYAIGGVIGGIPGSLEGQRLLCFIIAAILLLYVPFWPGFPCCEIQCFCYPCLCACGPSVTLLGMPACDVGCMTCSLPVSDEDLGPVKTGLTRAGGSPPDSALMDDDDEQEGEDGDDEQHSRSYQPPTHNGYARLEEGRLTVATQ